MLIKNLNKYIYIGTSLCSALLVRKLSKQLEVQALVRINNGNLFFIVNLWWKCEKGRQEK